MSTPRNLRFAPYFVLCSILTSASGAQIGGFGGGFGGSGGFAIPATDTFQLTQLLSPGARDDWPIQLQVGEVVLAGVKSKAFDPLVRVLGADGKVVAENDDIRPGEQDARLLYRAPRAGLYKIQVTGARETAGGSYDLETRRFVPRDVVLGAATTGVRQEAGIDWFRIRLAERQVLAVSVLEGNATELQVYGPQGQELPAANLALVLTKQRRLGEIPRRLAFGPRSPDPWEGLSRDRYLLRDRPAGDYYLRVPTRSGPAEVRVMPGLVHLGLPVGETPLRRLTPYGLDVWRIPVTRGQLLRVEAPSPEANVMVRLHFPTLPDARNA
ncbi:MAG: hypothetical protein FJX77_06480, partial [Armatimonadetes bacterium]|nr:hypothetical protein [Armatimonadota bacterium]